MLRIGIVDDGAAARERLAGMLRRYEEELGVAQDVRQFDCAAAFLADADKAFDILYLDIDMPGMSGMELARVIRETDSAVSIVFCTNLQQFAVNGYQVAALGFIVKPVQWYPFQLFHERAVKAASERGRRLEDPTRGKVVVKDGASQRVIDVADLLYVEVRKHTLYYHVLPAMGGKKAVVQTRGTMQAAAEELQGQGFARCSASYLVNLAHVDSVNRTDVLIGGETLSVSRTYKDSFKAAFAKYLALGE